MVFTGAALAVGSLVGVLLVAALIAILARRPSRAALPPLPQAPVEPSFDDLQAPTPRSHVAMVVNPTKVRDLGSEEVWLKEYCARLDLDAPHVFTTTVEDPGAGQTTTALLDNPQSVLAYGGDGTVRSVVSGLAGSGTPLGILPAGTGNLLARNLNLPLADIEAATAVALVGAVRTVDIARAEIDSSGEDHDPRHEVFCVMAGIGFDAEVMAGVEPQMKKRIGWAAYLVEGVRRVNGRRTHVTIRLDDREVIHRRARSVLVGNCGQLVGGVELLPDAELDDGWLDVAVFAPFGVFGWGAVVATVLTRSRHGHPVVEHFRCRSVEIRAERPLDVQVDGDSAGTARVLRARVDPGALVVRVP